MYSNKALTATSSKLRCYCRVLFALLICSPWLPDLTESHGQVEHSLQNQLFTHTHTPHNIPRPAIDKPILIAVVDDGVNTSHQDLQKFIWKNPGELPNNGIDDDGNGSIDDTHGWNVADFNNRLSPPPNRGNEFFHGTHLAGIISQISSHAFGSKASEMIRIMPVKVMSDAAGHKDIKMGFQGIEYAVNNGADIVLCAWSVGHISAAESEVLQRARNKGVLVISSAGNFPEEKKQYPAAHPSVLAVTSIDDKGRKSKFSNYEMFVDISAPGENIESADASTNDGYTIHHGTSQAAAIVAAAAALVKAHHPVYTPHMVTACLKSSANSLDVLNPEYSSKLGSGLVNIKAATTCRVFNTNTSSENYNYNAQGYIRLFGPEKSASHWDIKPYGNVKGFWFTPIILNGDAEDTQISISTTHENKVNTSGPYLLSELSEPFFISGTKASVRIQSENAKLDYDYLMAYRAEPLHSKTRFCRGTMELQGEGFIEDGSGDEQYEAGSDCKWLITAPPGKSIRFSFSKFDTQANTDLLYFFNGDGTNEKIMAVFSGKEIPPELTTWSNQVLVWFVTNEQTQGNGWKARFRFVEDTN